MSKMKSLLGMYAMMAAMGATDYTKPSKRRPTKEETEKEIEEKKKELDNKRIENLKKKGLKEFFYGDNSVLAINKKTADKKAKKLGYI